jgi:hypothetical protein
MFVANPGTPPGPEANEAARAAWAAAPVAVRNATEPLFPRAGSDRLGRCRICGAVGERTKEHVPIKAANNKSGYLSHELEDWFGRDDEGRMSGGVARQGGVWGYSLCERCNNMAGGLYGGEYKRWSACGGTILAKLGDSLPGLDAGADNPSLEVTFLDVSPGRFIRSALAALCTAAAGWPITDEYPVLRRIILQGETAPLPEPLRVYLTLYAGPMARIVGPTFLVDQTNGQWSWLTEIAHPPFAILMQLAGAAAPLPRLDLSEFTTTAPSTRGNFECTIGLGFGHTPLPGDYRPKGGLAGVQWTGPAPGS